MTDTQIRLMYSLDWRTLLIRLLLEDDKDNKNFNNFFNYPLFCSFNFLTICLSPKYSSVGYEMLKPNISHKNFLKTSLE